MITTLNAFAQLLEIGQRYRSMGRLREAATAFDRLIGLPDLPRAIAEKALSELAEICLKRRHFRRARRHVTAALTYAPSNAHYHYLLAVACRLDERGNLNRSADHYRRALRIDSRQVRCRAEYGLLLIRMEQHAAGLKQLRLAVKYGPDDIDAVSRLVKGLCRVGRSTEALKAAREALFRNSRSPQFQQLWQRLQYRRVLRQQLRGRKSQKPATPASRGPMVLPFVRILRESGSAVSAIDVRQDCAEPLAAPHFPRAARRRVQ